MLNATFDSPDLTYPAKDRGLPQYNFPTDH